MNLPLISAALLTSTSPLAQNAGIETVRPALPLASMVSRESDPVDEPSQDPTEVAAEATDVGEAMVSPETDQDQSEGQGDETSIIVTADSEARKRDPLVKLNESTFAITQDVDKAVIEPVADAYREVLPKPVRRGLRNFFRNLLEPVNFLNYLLQLKPGKAFETLGRFTINSTIGIAGLIDVAKEEPFSLPHRRNGFANTLGYYGVGPGPFLVLPLIGATSLRDVLGSGLDQAVLPIAIGAPFNKPEYGVPAYTVNALEFRIDFDERLEAINESDDPYFALRETYLCHREADIAALKNRPPPRDCSLEALFSEGLEDEANPAMVSPDGALEQGDEATGELPEISEMPGAASTDVIAAPVEWEAGDQAASQGQEPREAEQVAPREPAAKNPSLLTLENGCALLEKGVDTLHVVTC